MVLDADTLDLAPGAARCSSACPAIRATSPSCRRPSSRSRWRRLARSARRPRRWPRRARSSPRRPTGAALLAGAGAHPFAAVEGALSDGPRYDALVREYGPVARRQLVFGLHVHVAVRPADRALAVYNALRSYLPLIAALAANAPFYEGVDTGLASVRPKLCELLPRQGVPPPIASWEELGDALRWGQAAGAMADRSQWWWEARLHPVFGTVEVRVPDTQTTVAETAAVAAVVHALVAWLAERHAAGEALAVAPSWRIAENRWFGLSPRARRRDGRPRHRRADAHARVCRSAARRPPRERPPGGLRRGAGRGRARQRRSTAQRDSERSRHSAAGRARSPHGWPSALPGSARPCPLSPKPEARRRRCCWSTLRDDVHRLPSVTPVGVADPLADDDLHLALYLCYELHYRGLAEVDERWEWEPSLLALRREWEGLYEDALLATIGEPRAPATTADDMDLALREIVDGDEGPSLSDHLERRGTLEQVLEFVVHRSPTSSRRRIRTRGRSRGCTARRRRRSSRSRATSTGAGARSACTQSSSPWRCRSSGLDRAYGAYVDRLPGVTLATVNLMSLLGLHRRWRGAIVGHLAAFEMTSSLPTAATPTRCAASASAAVRQGFFDEHVEADAVHENVAAVDLAGGLARQEPGVAGDVLWGARALLDVEARWARHLLDSWEAGASSLLSPLGAVAA